MVAVLPDQVPSVQRGLVSGVLGVCTPIGSVCGTFVVKLFAGSLLAMFLAPCAIGGLFVLLFAATLNDRRLAKSDKPKWSLREFASMFYVNPRKDPDFSWAFASRFMFVFNIAGALPFSIAPAIAPAILVIGSDSYGMLYMVAGLCAIIGAFAILPVKRVR